MTMQQLEYFLSASRTLNFTQTAKHYFISQSAVTQQIKNLEQELGATLFTRKNRKLELTQAGRLFVREASSILSRVRDSVERVRAAESGMSGTLRLGYLKGIEMTRFPQIVQNFHNKCSGVQLNLQRDDAIALHDDFLANQYDLIFNVELDLLQYPNSEKKILSTHPFYVVMPPGHPLTRRKLIRQEDLRYEKLIIHAFNREIQGAPELVPRKYLDRNLMANVTRTEDGAETILILVASGIGLGILADFDLHRSRTDLNLIYVPLDTGGFRETLEVIYPEKVSNSLVSLFLEELL